MAFNILSISGSPRKKGNTELLVRAAIEPFTDDGHTVQEFFLSQKKVAPCIACEACTKDGLCVVQDDALDILENITSYDAVNGVSVVARERGEVLNQPESLNNANILGRNILNVLNMTNFHAIPSLT